VRRTACAGQVLTRIAFLEETSAGDAHGGVADIRPGDVTAARGGWPVFNRQEIETVSLRRFPGATREQIAVSASALMDLDEAWEETRCHDFASLAVHWAGAGTTLDLLHVIEWPWEEPPAPDLAALPAEQAAALSEFRRYLTASACSRLGSLVADSVPRRCAVSTRISHGKPYVEILKAAEHSEADLIVLGIHSRKTLDTAIFGSTTNHVVRAATCPVLTLRR
jgi:nucleotide-binding universal stress UspA family protein